MKYIKGLYMTLFLIFIINLVSTTIFDDKYSGIAIFISLGVFIIGNAFFINAKQLIISERE
ncbi:hypothetical protein GLV94_19475 [Virgibacillus halodenitrificans]|uniref:hypothetical protein n=1 Tax=Virgibacillus halodenitrificans TaxID=1482 RepID=UPI0009845401|nr:hypothetical protein [Virgibacillus halodenitrificans]MYL47821.1 hypothetical protein [Virgibacillus halodenitrificans]